MLHTAENTVTEIEIEIKTITATLIPIVVNDRQKAEQKKALKTREAEAYESRSSQPWKRNFKTLRKTVDKLKKQRGEKK